MTKRSRAWLAAGGALATFLLGLSAIGGVSVVPGPRTGFDWTSDGSALRLSADAGNFNTWIELHVMAVTGSIEPIASQLEDAPLGTRVESLGTRLWRIEVTASDTLARDQFVWNSGQEVLLTPSGNVGARVVRWTLHTAEGRDTHLRAAWRTAWFVLLLVAAIFSAGVSTWTAFHKAALAPPTLEEQAISVVKEIIEAIEGDDAEQTAQVRSLMRAMVLDGATPDEALRAVLPPDATIADRVRLRGRASHLFGTRVDGLRRRLAAFRDSLKVP